MTTGNFKIAGDVGSSEESSPVAGFMSKYIISLELFFIVLPHTSLESEKDI